MKGATPQPSDASSGEREVYTLKGNAASSHMKTRTAQIQAQFFLPRLHTHMSLLDCGCGPGYITCGLATMVAPGETVGIDVNPDDIQMGQALAIEQNLSNLRFETADVYELPFADGSFDAVFSHSLLEHLRDPLDALREMHRVLKPGGVIGVRSPDYQGHLLAPPDPLVARLWELYQQLSRNNGGNPRIGKHLRALLREAGFAHIEGSASYDLWTRRENPPRSFQAIANRFIELGWTDRDEFERIESAFEAWLDHPDMLNAIAYCEAIGWRP